MNKFKNFCKDNKALLVIALLLNIVFITMVILSLCGINIAKLMSDDPTMTKINNWIVEAQLTPFISTLTFGSNIYFAVSISSNDYTCKPLIYTISLLPIFYICQFFPGNKLIVSYLVPFCICLAYSFKFSTLWKSVLFLGIVTGYQYLMQMAKLSLFTFEYLNTSIINYLVLSIDLYVVFILYRAICKTIYKNKNKEVKEI